MDSRFSAASRNTRYFRALGDTEMLERLQSKPPRRKAQTHISSFLGYFSNCKRDQPYSTIETGEKWMVNLAEAFPLLYLGLFFNSPPTSLQVEHDRCLFFYPGYRMNAKLSFHHIVQLQFSSCASDTWQGMCTSVLTGPGQAGLWGFCGQPCSCFSLLITGGSSTEMIDSGESGYKFLIETGVN